MKTRELLPKDVTYYKANLHCHTVFSDGKMTPEEVKQMIFLEPCLSLENPRDMK